MSQPHAPQYITREVIHNERSAACARTTDLESAEFRSTVWGSEFFCPGYPIPLLYSPVFQCAPEGKPLAWATIRSTLWSRSSGRLVRLSSRSGTSA